MKVAALIPARSGSKGIPEKNFKEFCGKPLWMHTFLTAYESDLFDIIIISTDKKATEDVPLSFKGKAKIVWDDKRPDKLCTDKASLDDVLAFYRQEFPDIDVWCLLQPTSPLRTVEDINVSFAMLQEKDKKGEQKYDSVISVFNHPIIGWVANSAYHKGRKLHTALYHTNKRPNRQDRKDWYLENGAVYFVFSETLDLTHSRVGAVPALYVMPKERSIEIDDMTDWMIAEMLIQNKVAMAVAV